MFENQADIMGRAMIYVDPVGSAIGTARQTSPNYRLLMRHGLTGLP